MSTFEKIILYGLLAIAIIGSFASTATSFSFDTRIRNLEDDTRQLNERAGKVEYLIENEKNDTIILIYNYYGKKSK